MELGNLNRQLLHFTDDIGEFKTESAKRKLQSLNPHCRVEALHEAISEDNGEMLVGDAHLIVDGTDNLETRKILKSCVPKEGDSLLFWRCGWTDGHGHHIHSRQDPCFECLFPDGTPDKGPPGVLGPLPGIIGALQALAAINFLVGVPHGLLAGRMLYVDGATMNFKMIEMGKNSRCRVCGADL